MLWIWFSAKNSGVPFGIVVAGYPLGHPESPLPEMDIEYLNDKVDAGADFIVTQLFCEAQDYLAFARRC